MATIAKQLERERLLELAQEYRQKGYEVLLPPKPEDLPDFLEGYQPDMVVRRGEEAVVIEVKTSRSLTSLQYLRGLARAIEEHPGWRFELVVTNPEGVDYPICDIEDSLQKHEITTQLKVARELVAQHPESALLLAWSLTEASLRLLASQEGLRLKDFKPLHLLKTLAVEGVISKTEYQSLMNALALRNAIAHGFKASGLTQSAVLELIEVTEQLLDSLNVAD